MTNSHSDISSLNRVISLFPKIKGRRQTKWGGIKTFYSEQIWYANISPDIEDHDSIWDITDAPVDEVRMVWHKSTDNDSRHIWMRSLICSLFQRYVKVPKKR